MTNTEMSLYNQDPSAEIVHHVPLILLFTGPTGAGKTTVRDGIHRLIPETQYMPSITTREPRLDDVPGKDYIFVDEDRFDNLIQDGSFFEYNPYGSSRYGTLKKYFEPFFRGITLTKTIDMAGAFNFKQNVINTFDPGTANYTLARTIIFLIGVPHIHELKTRFLTRAGKEMDPTLKTIEKMKFLNRIRKDWKDWEKFGPSFEHVIINQSGDEGLASALSQVLAAIEQKRQSIAL